MRKIVVVLGLALLVVISVRAQQAPAPPAAPTFPGQAFQPGPREWAFPVITAIPPPEQGEQRVPGSTKTYTPQQIDDLVNPPDWFPESHPTRAGTGQRRGGRGALACGSCHLFNGSGHPESADVAGYTADYFVQTDAATSSRASARTRRA